MLIDYIEIPAQDVAAAKAFYGSAFDWTFTDYGPDYSSWGRAQAGLDGGFRRQDEIPPGAVLLVLKAENLEAARERVTGAGGRLSKDIFSFPGGRRFQFLDPSGNELAVWGE